MLYNLRIYYVYATSSKLLIKEVDMEKEVVGCCAENNTTYQRREGKSC